MTATDTHTCTCKVCDGRSITTPVGYISGTPRQVKSLVHNYVASAHSPVGSIHRAMTDRAGIEAA